MNKSLYIIAHRCNDLKKPAKALKQGANAIECDVWIDDEMNLSISHNGLDKQNIDEWLRLIAELKKQYQDKFELIIFDIKKCAPITDLLNKTHQTLPSGLKIIYSTSKLEDAKYLP